MRLDGEIPGFAAVESQRREICPQEASNRLCIVIPQESKLGLRHRLDKLAGGDKTLPSLRARVCAS